MIVSDHNNSCWGTNVPGHRRVWAQSCLGSIMYGQKRGGTGRYMLSMISVPLYDNLNRYIISTMYCYIIIAN